MHFTSRSHGPRPSTGSVIAALLLALNPFALAYKLDPNSTSELHHETSPGLLPDGTCSRTNVEIASVKSISKSIAKDMVAMYHGHEPGGTPGLLPEPYYCTKHSHSLTTSPSILT